jgi:hypothetical protein
LVDRNSIRAVFVEVAVLRLKKNDTEFILNDNRVEIKPVIALLQQYEQITSLHYNRNENGC